VLIIISIVVVEEDVFIEFSTTGAVITLSCVGGLVGRGGELGLLPPYTHFGGAGGGPFLTGS
jgi:hypothetical protein